jgi:hypothetical protein
METQLELVSRLQDALNLPEHLRISGIKMELKPGHLTALTLTINLTDVQEAELFAVDIRRFDE